MVQTAPYQNQAASELPDPWAVAGGRSIPAFKFSYDDANGQNFAMPVGTSYDGVLKENVTTRQQNDFVTGEPKTYSDGKPMLQIEAIFDTVYRDPEEQEDDGTRRFFFKGQSLRALQDEMRAKQVQRFGVGTQMTITLVQLKPTQKGYPQKIYEVTLSNIQPWASAEEAQTNQAIAPQQPQAQQQWAPSTPPVQQQAALQAAAAPGLDVAAMIAAAQAQQAQAAPASRVTAEHQSAFEALQAANIPNEAAIAAIAAGSYPGDAAFLQELSDGLAI